MGSPVRLGRRFIQNPHELYSALREAGPVAEAEVWGGVRAWLVTRYDDARRLLGDSRLGKSHARIIEIMTPELAGAFGSPLSAHMLNTDPPDHTRLRRLVAKAFTTRTVAGLRHDVEDIADDLIAALDGQETADLIASFALPLPIRVIGALLGVPAADQPRISEWMNPHLTAADEEYRARMHAALTEYLHDLIAAKRARPDDGLISALVATSDEGDQLAAAELVTMIFLLILAGYETTVNLIGNGLLALLREPARLAELRADPALLPAAVEEVLRFDGPLNTATNRFTLEPVTVGDVTIPAGELVLVSLLSANRDEAKFPGSADFDPHREASPHLAFGHGIHYCLGAPLARLEGEVALGRLLRAFPGLALDPAAGPPEYRLSLLMRGLTALPVRLR